MNKELLDLTPKRYFCPFCGKWHNWGLLHELGYYDSSLRKAKLMCENQILDCKHRKTSIYFSDGYCYYRTSPTCYRGYLDINEKILIEDIVENSEEPRVTFNVTFTTRDNVGSCYCSDCDNRNNCLMCKLADENNSKHMHITFGFEFEQLDYRVAMEKQKKVNKEDTTMANNNMFNMNEDTTTANNNMNEDTTTANNNMFNMNMEFGPNTDKNIVSTMMGVAVKHGNSWRIYDKKKKEITDIGNMQLGSLPIFIMPTIHLEEGDLIKDNEEYYFVTKVSADGKSTQTLSARTGEISHIIPIKNVLGFTCYSKVIALGDTIDIGEDFDMKKLIIMSSMTGQSGANGGQMNQLLPLLLFKKELGNLGKDDDMMKMLLAYSMMGNTAGSGSGNPFMNYMMYDSFTKKSDKHQSPLTQEMPEMQGCKQDKPYGNSPLVIECTNQDKPDEPADGECVFDC